MEGTFSCIIKYIRDFLMADVLYIIITVKCKIYLLFLSIIIQLRYAR